MNRHSSEKLLAQRVAEILMQWDPIEVANEPNASDEYNSYVAPILSLILQDGDVTTIRKMLTEIRVSEMCLPLDEEADQFTAEMLFGLTSNRAGR